MIVTPDRDAPGTRASVWNRPISSTSRQVMPASSRPGSPAAARRWLRHSANANSRPKPIRAEAMTVRLRNSFSISGFRSRPKKTTGTVPRAIIQARTASGVVPNFVARRSPPTAVRRRTMSVRK